MQTTASFATLSFFAFLVFVLQLEPSSSSASIPSNAVTAMTVTKRAPCGANKDKASTSDV